MRCRHFKNYLRRHGVTKRVRDEVQVHMASAGKFSGFNLNEFLVELPDPIRVSVCAGLFFDRMYMHMHLFRQLIRDEDEAFALEFCGAVRSVFYGPYAVMQEPGTTALALQYLAEGEAWVQWYDPERIDEFEEDEEKMVSPSGLFRSFSQTLGIAE